MLSKKYRLSYLPLFYEDLDEKITYIVEKLKNPKAANDLLDKVETAIIEEPSNFHNQIICRLWIL